MLCGLVFGYQVDMCLEEIGLRAQNNIIILSIMVNIILGGGGDV